MVTAIDEPPPYLSKESWSSVGMLYMAHWNECHAVIDRVSGRDSDAVHDGRREWQGDKDWWRHGISNIQKCPWRCDMRTGVEERAKSSRSRYPPIYRKVSFSYDVSHSETRLHHETRCLCAPAFDVRGHVRVSEVTLIP